MAYRKYEVDDSYANEDGQHFVKIYVDFDAEAEALRFAELAEDEFGEAIAELAERAVRDVARAVRFNDEQDLLWFFEGGGILLDKQTGIVYKSDVNLDGEFFGIFEYEPVPMSLRYDYDEAFDLALEWSDGSQRTEHEAPGGWFSELAETVLAEPERFIGKRGE